MLWKHPGVFALRASPLATFCSHVRRASARTSGALLPAPPARFCSHVRRASAPHLRRTITQLFRATRHASMSSQC